MALDRLQKQMLKRFVTEDGWDVLMKALQEYTDELLRQPVSGQNEFETLRMLFEKQGGVDHLKAFFEKIEKGALQ